MGSARRLRGIAHLYYTRLSSIIQYFRDGFVKILPKFVVFLAIALTLPRQLLQKKLCLSLVAFGQLAVIAYKRHFFR